MSQLLISVKNVEEALIASYANVDLIDLKDPNVGALGALDTGLVSQIVDQLDEASLISATVGEGHKSVEALVLDIQLYASLDVDVIKIAVSDLFYQDHFFDEMLKLTMQGVKLVAVFFADEMLKLNLVQELERSGFYGAMLDTKLKQVSLTDVQSIEALKKFLALCEKHQLVSGLAGSINKKHIDSMVELNPTFIGMRGGVCEGYNRVSALSNHRVIEVKKMLLNYNKT